MSTKSGDIRFIIIVGGNILLSILFTTELLNLHCFERAQFTNCDAILTKLNCDLFYDFFFQN